MVADVCRILAVVVGLLAFPASAVALTAGTTIQIDRPSDGSMPFDGINESSTSRHAISSDGCFIVYASAADTLLSTDENAAGNVYRLNRCLPGGLPDLVSVTADGTSPEPGSHAGGRASAPQAGT